MSNCNSSSKNWFLSNTDESWLWHKKLAHVNIYQLGKLLKNDLVIGLPKLNLKNDLVYDACQKDKQTKSSFKLKNEVTTNKPFQLLHMDLVGPARVKSLGGNFYTLVIVNYYSRFT